MSLFRRSRWTLSLLIVAVVLVASVAIIVRFREAPSALAVRAVSDGSGGAIVAWQDSHSIRVQRVDASGQVLWHKGGVLVEKIETRVNQSAFPGLVLFTLTADGTGGAIITWQDRHTYPGLLDAGPVDVYSQRVGDNGELLWGDGVRTGKVDPVSTDRVQVVPDGTGGAIFGWDDYKTYFRGLHDDFLRLQKIGPDGQPMWGDQGVLVTASSPYHGLTPQEKAQGIPGAVDRSFPTYTGYQRVVSDGSGGAVVLWYEEDYPNRSYLDYAQRVDADGGFVWAKPVLVDTTRVNSPNSSPNFSSIYAGMDNGEGLVALVTWAGGGGGLTDFICLDTDGQTVWQHPVSSTMGYQPDMAGDGLNGIIICRENIPIGPPSERSVTLYLQRLDAEGNAVWPEGPVVVTDEGWDVSIDVAGDGNGGAMVSWRLRETGSFVYGRIFAQKLDTLGTLMWGEGGAAVFPGPSLEYQGDSQIISSDPGAIVVAPVGAGALQGNMVYAQKLGPGGNLLWGDGVRIDR